MSTQIPGYATKYTILKSGGGAAVAKGKTVTVHATGVIKETGKVFWSTKDPGQEPFTYQAGVGQVKGPLAASHLPCTAYAHCMNTPGHHRLGSGHPRDDTRYACPPLPPRPLLRPPASAPCMQWPARAQARSES